MALWDRNQPQFYNVWDLDWETINDFSFFEGIEARTISKNPDTGAGSFMVKFPPGWSHKATGDDATLEMFIIDGDVTANGQRLGAGGFIAVPKKLGPADLASEGGAQAYVFWNTDWVDDFYYDNQVEIVKVWEKDWIPSVMPGLRHGIMHKSLRWPDPHGGEFHGGPGGMVRFIMMAPGFGEPRQEVHWDCWEEMVWLTGDLLMPERGMHAAGSYLSNPPDLKHGPLLTAKGSLLLLHCDKPMGAEFHDLQDADGEEVGTALKAAFLDGESWLKQPQHADWDNRPEHPIYPNIDPVYATRTET